MADVARVPSGVFWSTSLAMLGRMACVYADPSGRSYPHDHAGECLHDDQAVVADTLLGLAAAVATGDESAMLDWLEVLNDTVTHG